MRWILAIVLAVAACAMRPALSKADDPAGQPNRGPAAVSPPDDRDAPPAAPVDGAIGQRVLRRSAPRATQSAAASRGAPAIEWSRLLLALAVVLALILVMRWVMRRLMGGAAAARGSRFAEVLARTPITPRQHLVLIRVGSRLLVVADSGGQQMSTLCQITSADEVAAVLAQLRPDAADGLTRAFSGLVGQAASRYTASVQGVQDDGGEAAGATVAPNTDGDRTDSAEAADSAVQGTREQLRGLQDRIRTLSQQIGQTR
jgi:flagellar biogenesis protein FliO